MKMSKNILLAIALILTTLFAMFAILEQTAFATQYINVDNYCWIEGVLHNDTYTLYPYAQESMDIGFSKYGEMIGYNEATEIGLGIQYPGYSSAADEDLAPSGTYDQTIGTSVDPFCNEEIGVDWWMNGWFIDIKYTPLGEQNREIWAFAMFSDGSQHGGDWIVMPSVAEDSSARPLWQENPPYANPSSAAYSGIVTPIPDSGGRKTNGYCETDPIEIIYNGPRRFVAICRTKISDVGAAADLVDITFTFIYNKAEKNVIILKDIKRLYKKSAMNVQFGNRGEWDLGISPDTDSYIHWYTDEPVEYWDMNGLGTITLTEEEDSFEFFKDFFLEYKCPKKWWDEVPSAEIPTSVCDEWTEQQIDFPGTRYTDDISWNETQPTCYGRDWHYDQTIKEHSYAVAQMISKAGDYVGALAVWPHPEFWAAHNVYFPPKRTTVAGGGLNPSSLSLMLTPISRMLEWNKWTVTEDPTSLEYPHGNLLDRSDVWVTMDDVVTATGATNEPIIPFTIYENDFRLDSTTPSYRMVSVYMLTDRHDADDRDALRGLNEEDWTDGYNKIDREIQYQLDEIFNPMDIYDAMHKNTKSWVQFFNKGVEYSYTPWISSNIKAWDGETYHCLQLDSERTIESGLTIPSLPVYPGTEPGVRPTDWDNDHVLCWDAYCADTERVLVDTGSGYELIPRAVGSGVLLEPDDYKPNSLTSYNFLDPVPDTTRHYYTINMNTGRICFYEYDDVTETFDEWYLPTGSMVKVLWSSEHEATTAAQWDENDELYPINNETFQFPLHHDIIAEYKPDTEVFLIEEVPVRLLNVSRQDSPYYTFTKHNSKANITITGTIPAGMEIDVKYYKNDTKVWVEKKFISNGTSGQKLQLGTASNYTEKVWYHSEKALLGGDYVFNDAYKTLYMQDAVAAGQWLLVNYTVNGVKYINFFLGDGSTTSFVLHTYPDVGSVKVCNTEILQQIVNTTVTTCETPLGIRVPKLACWWTSGGSGSGFYVNGTWIKFGVLEEREWLNVTDTKVRGNWIIRETSTCDELVMDQAPLNDTQTTESGWPGQELKIVFKVPSGRWEWSVVGKAAASVDSLGNTMVVAAFKNKLIEFGLGGLDIQDVAFGPRIPSLIDETTSPDSIGRYSLHDDWCYSRTGDTDAMDKSWPISSSNIISVGGTAVNKVTVYFNDFAEALVGTTVRGTHGRAGIYAVTCWDKALSAHGFYEFPGSVATQGSADRYGYAIISTYKDKNGTIGLTVAGWSGQDTYYACNWFDVNKYWLQHLNLHVTDLILRIDYKYTGGALKCVPTVSIMETLGTISEKPQHDC
jgi:hypothetical protein